MGTEYRYSIAGNDLIMEEGTGFGPLKTWSFYRNLDEEARTAWLNYEDAKEKAERLRCEAIVASTNVRSDKELLQLGLCHNSDYVLTVPIETSILETRDGVKYNLKQGGSGGNKGGNGGGNNQNQNQQKQNQNQNGNQQGQQQQKQKGGNRRPMTMLELLTQVQVTLPNQSMTQH